MVSGQNHMWRAMVLSDSNSEHHNAVEEQQDSDEKPHRQHLVVLAVNVQVESFVSALVIVTHQKMICSAAKKHSDAAPQKIGFL